MEFEKLFQFIHGLSIREKKNFTRFTSGKKGDTLPILLYKRILATDYLDEGSLKKIKGKEFTSTATFCNNRNELLKLLIRSLVHYESGAGPEIPFIKQAYLIGATKLAEDAVIEEIAKAEMIEDFPQIIRIYDLIEDLNRYHGFGITLKLGKFSYAEALSELSAKLELNFCLDEISRVAKKNLSEQKATAAQLEGKIAPNLLSRTNNHLRAKILWNIHFLNRDLDNAFSLGQHYIELITSWPEKYPPVMIAKELSKIALQAAALLERERAMEYLFQMAALGGETTYSELQIRKSRIITGITIAAVFGEEALAERCFEELQANYQVFPDRIIPKLFHNLGMAFFYNENLPSAVKCFQLVRNTLKRTYSFLKWEPQALLAICHFEAGDFDLVQSFIRSAAHGAKTIELEYPKRAINLIANYCLSQSFDCSNLTTNLQEFENILKNENEKKASQDFSVDLWIESKSKSIPLKEVLRSRIAKERARLQVFDKLG